MRTRHFARLLGLLALALVTACVPPRRRTYCGAWADDVAMCCPDESYDALRQSCQFDIEQANAHSPGCGRAMHDYYACIEDVACDDGCPGGGPYDCAQESSAVLGLCGSSPPMQNP